MNIQKLYIKIKANVVVTMNDSNKNININIHNYNGDMGNKGYETITIPTNFTSAYYQVYQPVQIQTALVHQEDYCPRNKFKSSTHRCGQELQYDLAI
jgi:hypothetical protein